MRRRKLVIFYTLMFAALTVFLVPIKANADVNVLRADITLLGFINTDGGTCVLKLDDTTDVAWVGERNFILHESVEKVGYATLLTAISLNKTVRVKIAGDGSAGSLITNIYLNF